MRATADVVVIGGGVIGAATTYYLAQQGARVILLERSALGSGASTACEGAILMQTKHAGPHLAAARVSNDIYADLSQELDCDLEYRRHGSMVVAQTEDELRELGGLRDRQLAAQLPMEWLDAAECHELQPALADDVLAATLCPIDAEVNPMKVIFGYVAAAQRRSAQVWSHAEVTGITLGKDTVEVALADGRAVSAAVAVNAAGAWAPFVGHMLGVSLPIKPRRGMILVTEKIPATLRGVVLSAEYLVSKLRTGAQSASGLAGGLVASQVASGNVLLGSSREDVGYDPTVTSEGISHIGSRAIRTFPLLREVSLIRTYAGLRPATPDGLPLLGRVVGAERLVLAAGHEGDGIALAPWTGRVAADITLGKPPTNDISHLDYRRFERSRQEG